MRGQPIGQRLHLVVHRIVSMRRRAAHDVALDVAAGGQRRKLHLVDAADRFFQVALQHAVQLQALPRGDAQRGVADLVAQIELGQQLVAGQLAAGNLGADHEAVDFVAACTAAFGAAAGAGVAIVLLIGAVMLQQLGAVLAEMVVAVDQLRADVAAQVVAARLDDLDRTEFFFRHDWSKNVALPRALERDDWRQCLAT